MWTSAHTIEGPVDEPIALEAAKEFLRIEADDTTFDAELRAVISGARDDVERITGTRLISQVLQIRASEWADLLRLPIGPVEAVVSIAYVDQAGAEQVLDPARYELFGAGLERGIRPAFGQGWPNDARPVPDAISVTLDVGYGSTEDAIPAGLVVTMLRAIRAQFEDKPLEIEASLTNHRIWL